VSHPSVGALRLQLGPQPRVGGKKVGKIKKKVGGSPTRSPTTELEFQENFVGKFYPYLLELPPTSS